MAGTTLRELIAKIGFEVDDKQLRNVDQRLNNFKRSVGSLITDLKYVAIASTGAGVGIGFIVNQSAKMEQAKVAFEVLTGSAEQAQKTIKELTDFARITPFTIPQVLDNAKILMGYGVEVEKIIPTMKKLGDIAAVNGGDTFPQLALAFGQIKAKGHLAGQEMLQLTNAFVGRNDLAKMLNIKPENFDDMMAQGTITFDMIDQAFTKMTSKGGRFYDMMFRQSKTFLGLISNIKDFLLLLSSSIGDTLLPEAKNLASAFLKYVEVNRELIKANSLVFFKELIKFLKFTGQMLYAVVRVFKIFAFLVGGTTRAIKLLSSAIMAFLALRFAYTIGNIIIAFYGLASAATTANIAMIALPVGIAVAVGLAILAIEDLISYFEGKDSVVGRILEMFDDISKWPVVLQAAFTPVLAVILAIKAAVWATKKMIESLVDVNLFFREKKFLKNASTISTGDLGFNQYLNKDIIKGISTGDLGFNQYLNKDIIKGIAEPNPILSGEMLNTIPTSPLGGNKNQTIVNNNFNVNSPINMNSTGGPYSDGVNMGNAFTDTLLRNAASALKPRYSY